MCVFFVEISTEVTTNNFMAHHAPDIFLDLFCAKETSKYIYLKAKTFYYVPFTLYILLLVVAYFLVPLIDKNSIWLPMVLHFLRFLVCFLQILLFKQSIAKELIFNFEILFCMFNVLIFTLTDLMMKIREINFELVPIFGYIVLICIPRFIVYTSFFYYDCLSFDLYPVRVRQCSYTVFAIVGMCLSFYYSFFPRPGNFMLTGFGNYKINIQDKFAASFFSLAIFNVKLFLYAIIFPQNYVMYSTSLRRK
jgi:hypothetical protein